jgi:hypothetical protein
VPGLAFDLVNPRDVERGMSAERARGILGHFSGFGQGLGGRQFHRQPLLELILFAEDPAHFWPRVPIDH